MDIGSNSIHLTLARIHHDGGPSLPRVEIMATLKDAARLAAYLGPDGNLSPAGIDRAIETLRRYRRVADEHHAEVRAAATAAMRAARNADDLVLISDVGVHAVIGVLQLRCRRAGDRRTPSGGGFELTVDGNARRIRERSPTERDTRR